MNNVITVENLSKKYIISHQRQERFATLRDIMAEKFKNAGRRLSNSVKGSNPRSLTSSTTEEFWALKDISFEVKQGDRIGIIGRNGAGKSTLLKILSRITEPTTGKIRIMGRIASLLEVGTGFHPELTGRENIYLNGAILGMRKEEIRKKFDEIVAFAEVEKFLDTPVKRYSSGMYVRLAFAVAAHLETEILLVDEVLAVGDVEFQKKCLSKMGEVTYEGKTVLLVSHNLSTILSLSTKCILLTEGNLIKQGMPHEVIATYQNSFNYKTSGQTDLLSAEHYGTGKARFVSIFMRPLGKDGGGLPFPETGCDLEFEVIIKAYSQFTSANVGLTIYDELGNRVIDANTIVKGDLLSLKNDQIAKVRFLLKNILLKPDYYTTGLWLGIANHEDIDGVRYATSFMVEARREDILYSKPFPGVYACEFEHNMEISIHN